MIKFLQILSIISLPLLILLPIENNLITICPFFQLTALPCPGCGLGRALLHIYHFDFFGALLFNPFGYILFLGQWYFLGGMFFQSLAGFALKQKEWILRFEMSLMILFFSYGFIRIWVLLDNESIFRPYFYNFNQTFSLVKWL